MIIPTSIKAIIFDYDGVLGDSSPFNAYACKEAAKKCDIELADDVYQKCAPGGATIQNIATCIVTHYGKPELAKQYVEYKKTFDQDYVKEVTILSNVETTVQNLAKQYPLAINTGTRHVLVDSVIHKYMLDKYFQVVVAAEDITRGKPNPESYVLAANLLGTPPQDCLVVEDGTSGVMAAKRAGCYVIGITNSLTRTELEELGCDEIITDLSELMVPTSA